MVPAPPRRPDRRYRPAPGALEGRCLPSLTIQIRYDDDANGFFDTQAKRDLMQAVADSVAAALPDSLAAIDPGGADHWAAIVLDPATGAARTMPDLVVPADTIIIEVGGRPLDQTEAGVGGAGGYSIAGNDPSWADLIRGRGKPGAIPLEQTQMSLWGGSIAFDTAPTTDWYFGTDPSGIAPGQADFVSVATHELGHVLGIGDTTSGSPWERLATRAGFVGPAAEAANGGRVVPLQVPGADHWAEGTTSDGAIDAMDPVQAGYRNVFSTLDYAALGDLGWTVAPPSRFRFAASTVAASPGAGAVAITVERIGPIAQAAAIAYATGDGPPAGAPGSTPAARAGADYQPIAGVLDFAPGETSKTIAVPILDPTDPAPRSFHLILTDPTDLEAAGDDAVTTIALGGSPAASGGGTTPPVVAAAGRPAHAGKVHPRPPAKHRVTTHPTSPRHPSRAHGPAGRIGRAATESGEASGIGGGGRL